MIVSVLMFVKFLVLLSVIVSLSAKELEFYTENSGYNNYLDTDGKIKGYNYEIVKEMMKRQKLNLPITLTTWSRAYGLIQCKPNIALFSMTRTKPREKIFKWVGPLHQVRFVLYGLKDDSLKIESFEAAKKVDAIGCYKNDVRETYLKNKGFTNLSSLTGEDANYRNFQKLIAGRIRLWVTSDHVLYRECKKHDVDMKLFEEKFVLKKSYVYLAFSKGVSDEIVKNWQKTLDEMKADGSYKKIMLNYPTGDMTMTFDKAKKVE